MGLNFDEFKDNFNDINDDYLKSGLGENGSLRMLSEG